MSTSTQTSTVLEKLRARLAAEPDIAFASVFGSVATGTAQADSDIDVGVLAESMMHWPGG